LWLKMKNRLQNEADDIKNGEFKRENTGTVCPVTHIDGIKRQSLINAIIKIREHCTKFCVNRNSIQLQVSFF